MKAKHIRAYMESAYAFSRCSSSTRLQVGAVLVKDNRIISCGYNALPEHLHGPLEDESGITRPEVRHAEVNCLNGLRRSSESAVGATLFVTHSCCPQCAIEVIDSGVTTVYYDVAYRLSGGISTMIEAGIKVIPYETVIKGDEE